MIIKLLCLLFGLYLFTDAFYLGVKHDGRNKDCLVIKYVGAFMSGAYLIFLSAKDLMIRVGLFEADHHLFISNEAAQIMLLFGVTISLFMFADTKYRILFWLKVRHYKIYLAISWFDHSDTRRRVD